MFGKVSEQIEVKVAANEAWKLYRTLQIDKIIVERLPHFFDKIDIEGDGSVGTILHIFPAPGSGGGLEPYKEKITVVDEEQRKKEGEVVEGAYLDLGFSLYRVRYEVIEVEGKEEECITRATVEYEVKAEDAANASLVSIQLYVAIMQAIADYLQQNHHIHG